MLTAKASEVFDGVATVAGAEEAKSASQTLDAIDEARANPSTTNGVKDRPSKSMSRDLSFP